MCGENPACPRRDGQSRPLVPRISRNPRMSIALRKHSEQGFGWASPGMIFYSLLTRFGRRQPTGTDDWWKSGTFRRSTNLGGTFDPRCRMLPSRLSSFVVPTWEPASHGRGRTNQEATFFFLLEKNKQNRVKKSTAPRSFLLRRNMGREYRSFF